MFIIIIGFDGSNAYDTNEHVGTLFRFTTYLLCSSIGPRSPFANQKNITLFLKIIIN
jgi:hypothetical protein